MASERISEHERDRRVRRDLYLEGAANLSVLVAKAAVGFMTGSLAVLGDALHSMTDVANNIVALVVMRHSVAPPDDDHPYGHRKFETLAVFVLAVLLTVVAVELVIRGLAGGTDREVERHGWSLAVMIGVLVVNVAIAAWQAREARLLESDILEADAKHTFADVLTTLVVIGGWQVAAAGYGWVDTVAAFVVAAIVLRMAFGLFQSAVPVLVDQAAIDSSELHAAVRAVPGVREVRQARSRHIGTRASVDVTVTVDRDLSNVEAHEIADNVEAAVHSVFDVAEIQVHVEPHEDDSTL